jgi:hypothetical protein
MGAPAAAASPTSQPTLAQGLLRDLNRRVENNRRMAAEALDAGEPVQAAYHTAYADATEWAIRDVTNLRLVEVEQELRGYDEAPLEGIDQYQAESR